MSNDEHSGAAERWFLSRSLSWIKVSRSAVLLLSYVHDGDGDGDDDS